jgi:glutamate dehydrogenase (NAD(P)+)
MTVEATDPSTGVHGWVCIHSYSLDGASGGMRCVPDVSREEVQLLARAMTHKYSIFGIELGGAKAGLQVPYDATPDEKKRLVQLAARHLSPMVHSNLWSPWLDMNFTGSDLAAFYAAIGIEFAPSSGGGSSFRTALSTAVSLDAVYSHFRLKPAGTRIALEGFGNVARYLAPMLIERGATVVAATNRLGGVHNQSGLDLQEVLKAIHDHGERWVLQQGRWESIARDEVFKVPCEIFMPSARTHSIGADTARAMDTRIVHPIANVPSTDEALAVFDARGIVYMPDYVVNGGGVCGHVLVGAKPGTLAPAMPFITRFQRMVERLLKVSDATGQTVRGLANAAAGYHYASLAGAVDQNLPLMNRVARRWPSVHALSALELQRRSNRTLQQLDSLFAD